MANTNYLTSTVLLLEAPNLEWKQDRLIKMELRAVLPERKENKLVHLVVWGELGNRNLEMFKPYQYLLLEGFLSLLSQTNSKTKKFQITAVKIYPIF
jgi:hypothetical protein